ncbi:arsenate reductase ArsC [Methanotorris igneus]|uniref:Protein tyrosine phosphatase n=1 Tax=Methanotorris igneus (strain DSM 5666 / JCM 11834 / Kol 5) TaxID=880724 RepID=F6BEI9_METIK|nr:arsenate reductase ArsC [Methanotorris igneus]AEF95650.1 protein tyrosine phosphatase [Methanotorris igneus Kol 5]
MKVLFVCVHNKRRSIMAEAFGKKYGLNAYSAGLEKTDGVDEKVVEVLKEKNLNAKQKPQTIDEVVREVGNFDVVVTMGCLDKCPFVPAKKHISWNIEDPAGKDIEVYRKIRDEIEEKVKELTNSLKDI